MNQKVNTQKQSTSLVSFREWHSWNSSSRGIVLLPCWEIALEYAAVQYSTRCMCSRLHFGQPTLSTSQCPGGLLNALSKMPQLPPFLDKGPFSMLTGPCLHIDIHTCHPANPSPHFHLTSCSFKVLTAQAVLANSSAFPGQNFGWLSNLQFCQQIKKVKISQVGKWGKRRKISPLVVLLYLSDLPAWQIPHC